MLNAFDMRDGGKYRIYCRYCKKNRKSSKTCIFRLLPHSFWESMKYRRKADQPQPHFPLSVFRLL